MQGGFSHRSVKATSFGDDDRDDDGDDDGDDDDDDEVLI